MHLTTSDLSDMSLGFGGYTCNWGTHFCGLYETESERDEIMFGFLAQGIRERELLVCCPDDQHHDHALEMAYSRCPDVSLPSGLGLISQLYYVPATARRSLMNQLHKLELRHLHTSRL